MYIMFTYKWYHSAPKSQTIIVTLQVYNQKMKHLLYEQQNMIATIKADNEQALKLQREQFSKREGELV